MKFARKTVCLLAAVLLLLGLAACGGPKDTPASSPAPAAQAESSSEVDHLVKLCKVWGYTKYRHPTFLKGEKDWDAELQALIPQVRAAQSSQQVNELLHTWFVGLGEVKPSSGLGAFVGRLWTSLWSDTEQKSPQGGWFVPGDQDWVQDEGYLGEALAEDLGKLSCDLSVPSSNAGPVVWKENGSITFSNETAPDLDAQDVDMRLTGMFRFWNAVEYYDPYVDLTDQSWEQTLQEVLPQMLKADTQQKYEQVLLTMAVRLQDEAVALWDMQTGVRVGLADATRYAVPTPLAVVQEQLVVAQTIEGCPLEQGDVLLAVDGHTFEEQAQRVAQWYSTTREEVLLSSAARIIAAGDTPQLEVTVQRQGQLLTLSVSAEAAAAIPQPAAYEMLEGNIALLHPELLENEAQLYAVMKEVKAADALILDLRSNSQNGVSLGLCSYLPALNQWALTMYMPAGICPGGYTQQTIQYGYISSPYLVAKGIYPWEKPAVVLVDQSTDSVHEMVAAILRTADNVTLLGRPTTGALGGVVYLPLPGGVRISFSPNAMTAADGTQLQRVGVCPDVYVEPTVQGIAQGQDEQLEAAWEFLKNKGR